MPTQEQDILKLSGTTSLINMKHLSVINSFDDLYKGFISVGTWIPTTISGIDNSYQDLYDQTLFNNLGIISNNLSFQKMKDYEIEYKKSSPDFYSLWNNGEFIVNQETFDWAGTYKNLFLENLNK